MCAELFVAGLALGIGLCVAFSIIYSAFKDIKKAENPNYSYTIWVNSLSSPVGYGTNDYSLSDALIEFIDITDGSTKMIPLASVICIVDNTKNERVR